MVIGNQIQLINRMEYLERVTGISSKLNYIDLHRVNITISGNRTISLMNQSMPPFICHLLKKGRKTKQNDNNKQTKAISCEN